MAIIIIKTFPFRENKLTKSVSPIKMFEYLASGLPVVSTRMEEAESLNPPIYFANSKEDFKNCIIKAYKDGRDKIEFFEFAERNSWGRRYRELLKILNLVEYKNK